jgi:hypothetical protein
MHKGRWIGAVKNSHLLLMLLQPGVHRHILPGVYSERWDRFWWINFKDHPKKSNPIKLCRCFHFQEKKKGPFWFNGALDFLYRRICFGSWRIWYLTPSYLHLNFFSRLLNLPVNILLSWMASILVCLYFQKEPQPGLKMQYSWFCILHLFTWISWRMQMIPMALVVSVEIKLNSIYLLPYLINRLSNGVTDFIRVS